MSERPRLLFFARDLGFGGAERQLVLLARGLAETGWEISVLTMYKGGALEGDLGTQVRLLSMGKRGRWDNASLLRGVRNAVRQQRPHLVHSYLDAPNAIMAACRLMRLVPQLVWGVRASDMDWSQYDLARRLSFEATRILSRVPALIIANSHAGRDVVVAQGYPGERVTVIPNAIDVERFRPDPLARERIRAEWGLSSDTAVIGVLGRLDPMKGHEVFLAAAARLAANRDARFVIAGSGDAQYAARLRALPLVQRMGDRVRWFAARPDVPAVLNALDVLVVPSLWGEGFPNVLGEAMACGTACIASDCGDSAFVLGPHGELVPRGDADALAAALMRTLDRTPAERAATQGAARESIVRRFSPRQLVRQTHDALIPLVPPR